MTNLALLKRYKQSQDWHAHLMIFSRVVSMLLCIDSRFCSCPESIAHCSCPHHVIKSPILANVELIAHRQKLHRATQTCDQRFQLFGAKSLAAVADTEPNFNNAAVKQTLQVDVRADLKNLLAARRYGADRSDCDN